MLELYQTEWCPSSRRVRQRLTELGVDFVARQVPVEREDREALRHRTGVESIPVLVTEAGVTVTGEEGIEAYLCGRFEETPESEAHRRRAAKARQRELEEATACSIPATRSAAPRPHRLPRLSISSGAS